MVTSSNLLRYCLAHILSAMMSTILIVSFGTPESSAFPAFHFVSHGVCVLSIRIPSADGAITYHYRTRYVNNYAGSYGGGVSFFDSR